MSEPVNNPRGKLLALAALFVALVCVCAIAAACASATLGNDEGTASDNPSSATGREEELVSDSSPESGPKTGESGDSNDESASSGRESYEAGVVLAVLEDGVSADQLAHSLESHPELADVKIVSAEDGLAKLALPEGLEVAKAAALVEQVEGVAAAQANHYYYLDAAIDAAAGTTSDPSADHRPKRPQATRNDSDRTGPSPAAQGEVAETSARNPGAQSAEPAGLVAGIALRIQSIAVNDPRFGDQWALTSINAPDAWESIAASGSAEIAGTSESGDALASPALTSADNPVGVAVIDAGFRVSHEDLKDNLAATYNVVTKSTTIRANNKTSSSLNHGTHAAGIVSARTNNSLGIAGVANNACRIVAVRVEDSAGDITTEYLVRAYKYLTENAGKFNIKVANVSLGSGSSKKVDSSTDPALYKAIDDARAAGIVTVAAACNSDEDFTAPFYAFPADFDNVISVMNLRQNAETGQVERDPSSNYNRSNQKAKDISAPGERIYSLYGNSDSAYGEMSGTSMAAPVTAGVLGLIFASEQGISADEATSKLFSGAVDLGAAGWDALTGHGEVSASGALSASTAYLTGSPAATTTSSTQLGVKIGGVEQPAGEWAWASSDPKVATVAGGLVTGKSVGQTIVTATHGGLVATQTVSIAQGSRDVADLEISIEAATYNGSARTPVPVVHDGGTKLKSGTHFTVEYRNNVNAGSATAVISGVAPYTGSVKKHFKIEKAPFNKANVTLSETQLSYTGKKRRPGVTAADIGTNAGVGLVRDADFVVRGAGVRIGTGSVTVAATEQCANFAGSVTLEYRVRVQTKPVFRLVNSASGQWAYTADARERKSLARSGWTFKGVAWRAPSKSRQPVYCLVKAGAARSGKSTASGAGAPSVSERRYVAGKAARDKLRAKGWKSRGVAFYADDFKTRPVYRVAAKGGGGPWRYVRFKSTSAKKVKQLARAGRIGKTPAFYAC